MAVIFPLHSSENLLQFKIYMVVCTCFSCGIATLDYCKMEVPTRVELRKLKIDGGPHVIIQFIICVHNAHIINYDITTSSCHG